MTLFIQVRGSVVYISSFYNVSCDPLFCYGLILSSTDHLHISPVFVEIFATMDTLLLYEYT